MTRESKLSKIPMIKRCKYYALVINTRLMSPNTFYKEQPMSMYN